MSKFSTPVTSELNITRSEKLTDEKSDERNETDEHKNEQIKVTEKQKSTNESEEHLKNEKERKKSENFANYQQEVHQEDKKLHKNSETPQKIEKSDQKDPIETSTDSYTSFSETSSESETGSHLPTALHLLRTARLTSNDALRTFNCEKVRRVIRLAVKEALLLWEGAGNVKNLNLNYLTSNPADISVSDVYSQIFKQIPLLSVYVSVISSFVHSPDQTKRDCAGVLSQMLPLILYEIRQSGFLDKSAESKGEETIKNLEITKSTDFSVFLSAFKLKLAHPQTPALSIKNLFAQPDTFATSDVSVIDQKRNLKSSLGVETAMVGKQIIDEVLPGDSKNTKSKRNQKKEVKQPTSNKSKNENKAEEPAQTYTSSFSKSLSTIKTPLLSETLEFISNSILSEYWIEREGSLLFIEGVLLGMKSIISKEIQKNHRHPKNVTAENNQNQVDTQKEKPTDLSTNNSFPADLTLSLSNILNKCYLLLRHDKFTDYQDDVSTIPVRVVCARVIGSIHKLYDLIEKLYEK